MIFVILAIILLAAGVGVHFLVKKEKKRQVERRAIKVKIAEGDFDSVPEDKPVKKKPKPKRGKPGVDYKIPVPDYVMADLEKHLPGLIARSYTQVQTLHETAAAMKASGNKLIRAKSKMCNVIFPVGQSAVAQNEWMSHALNLRQAVEEISPEHCTASNAFSRAHSALLSTSDALDKQIKAVDTYDLENLPQELLDLVDIARVVKAELPLNHYNKIDSGDLSLPPEYDVRRYSRDLLALDLIEIFERELARMFPLAARLTVTANALAESTGALKMEVASSTMPEPEKPTDTDVGAYISRAEAWSTKVQKARETVEARLKEMEEAQGNFDTFLPELQLAFEQANEIALDGGKHLASSELHRCNTAYQHILAFAPTTQPILNACYEALNNDHSVFIVTVEETQEEVEGGVPIVDADVAVQTETGEAQDEVDEAALMAALRSSMRKLGFALAQKCAAQGKVDATMAQGLPPADHLEPKLDESSGEAYLRRFSQWQKALADQNTAGEARKERLTAFTEQATARAEQVKPAALALAEQIDRLTRLPDMSRELDILARAANLICKKYKNV